MYMLARTARNFGYLDSGWRPASISNRLPVMMGEARLHAVQHSSANAAGQRLLQHQLAHRRGH